MTDKTIGRFHVSFHERSATSPPPSYFSFYFTEYEGAPETRLSLNRSDLLDLKYAAEVMIRGAVGDAEEV